MWDFSLHLAGLKNRNKLRLYDYKSVSYTHLTLPTIA